MVGEDVPHRQLVRRVGRSSRCAQVSCEARCSPTSGRCAMPIGRRRCSGGGGTPFPAPRPPRYGNLAVRGPVRAGGYGAGRRAQCRCVAERDTALKARVLHAEVEIGHSCFCRRSANMSCENEHCTMGGGWVLKGMSSKGANRPTKRPRTGHVSPCY